MNLSQKPRDLMEFADQNNKILRELWSIIEETHPELVRLKGRVDELLKSNTELVLENREYKRREETLDEMLDNSCLCETDGSVYQKVADLMLTAQLKGAEESGVQEAISVLFKALGWSSGGLGSAAIEIVEERDKFRNAIKEHRSQKADDRCIEDDDVLYEVLGDGIKCDRNVGSKEEMLKNCARFIDKRCQGGVWPTYAQLEARVKYLEQFGNDNIRTIGPNSPVEIIKIHKKVDCEDD